MSDIKRTLAEVASNIKQSNQDIERLNDRKLERSDVQYLLQAKVSHDEMKNYYE